ncbi:elongation factor G [Mariprofundus micogutta]|uniref:Elongation factor G n=1 Tax=Mariprofundus micogutta TaxID=1921010 RepID=A0A1L8CN58_9PROT|nr:elongation factor G [Mariprofundus micogutta]GAV20350.1 elongation factor G [Mariprofundus micogutta]
MDQVFTSHIRNIALLDHEGAGETTLLESMLHVTGSTRRMGHIDDHNTISDFDPDEKELEKSLYCSTINFSYKGLLFNCLDVPGSPDAIADAMTALHAVEAALICIDVTDGIKMNTRRMWRLASQRGIPRFIAMTKLDADNADFWQALETIQAEFGNRCIPLYLPNASGSSFTSVHSVLHDRDAVAEGAATYEKIVEAIVETDDDLMEAYLEGEEISEQQLLAALKDALLHGSLFPVMPTAAENVTGTVDLLDLLCSLTAAPEEIERIVYRDGEPVSVTDLDGFAAYVYRTESDEFAGRISYVRILSGSISTHDTFLNRRSGKHEKIGHIFRVVGKIQHDISKATAGDLVAMPRIDDMHACDVITDDNTDITIDEMNFPKPMVSMAIRPKTNKDGQKLGTALHEFATDDSTFHVQADSQTHDLIISGMSDMHLQLILNKLKRRYKVNVETSVPQVPYMETITGKVSGIEYTHKKQSGGAGQFGRVVIDMEPLARGKGYEFVDKIHGGVIDAVFRTSVDKGIQAAMAEGVLAGFPATDVRVTLSDGKTHSVDSKDIAFQVAGQKAFKLAFQACRPVLLEPIVKMEITTPQDHIGDIMGDLNSRRAQIFATNINGNNATIEAQAPLAEVQSYQAQLKSITSGEGSYIIELDHYDIVPAAIQKRILQSRTQDS